MSGDTEGAKLSGVEEYFKKNKRKLLLILLFIVPAVVVAFYSISVSYYPFSFWEAMDAIAKHIGGTVPATYEGFLMDELVFNGTLPRAVGGLLAGAILGMCGAVMQSIIRNPLADPYTTGISSGALFGVTLFVILGFGVTSATGYAGQIANAFVFSLIPCAVIILFSIKRNVTPTAMVLVGIAVMYIFSASTMMLKYTADPHNIQILYEWSIGTLSKVNWSNIPFLAVTFITLLLAGMIVSNKINLVSSGDNISTTLGLNPKRFRIGCLIAVSVCTAVVVCFTGSIGFVGLVIPHIARIFVGSDAKYLIPCSAVLGALLLIGADSVARVAGSAGLPVGVITALIGSPVFLYFLIRMKTTAWGK